MDPATTWIDADVVLGRGRDDPARHPAARRHRRRRGRRDRSRHHAQGLRDRRRRAGRPHPRRARGDRRPGATSARSPTCGPAPSSAPAARSAPSSRPRTPRSATAPRSRTCPTSATPRSARAPTSAPARSSPTTTASQKHRTTVGRHAKTGSNNTFVAPVEIGDGAGHRRRHRRTPRRTAGRAGRLRRTAAQPRGLGPAQAGRDAAGRGRGGRRAGHGSRSWAGAVRWGRIVSAPTAPSADGERGATHRERNEADHREEPHGLQRPGTPRARRGGRRRCSAPAWCRPSAYEFANSEIYVRYEESVRGCDAFVIQSHTAPINEWIMEHLIMVDALKRASAKRITVVHAVLRLRPPGQEAPRPRADLGAADGRPVQDRRRRPADRGRPARRPDPGLLRRPGRPPDGAADPRRLRPREVRRPAPGRRLAGRRPDQGGRALVGPPRRRARWPSSTRPATSTGPTRRSPTASSARSTAGSASWSTT